MVPRAGHFSRLVLAIWDKGMPRFEDLPEEVQVQASRALAHFFRRNGYNSLLDACERLGLTPQEVWDQIMEEAGLPPTDVASVI